MTSIGVENFHNDSKCYHHNVTNIVFLYAVCILTRLRDDLKWILCEPIKFDRLIDYPCIFSIPQTNIVGGFGMIGVIFSSVPISTSMLTFVLFTTELELLASWSPTVAKSWHLLVEMEMVIIFYFGIFFFVILRILKRSKTTFDVIFGSWKSKF